MKASKFHLVLYSLMFMLAVIGAVMLYFYYNSYAPVAQRKLEHSVSTRKVIGSNPIRCFLYAPIAQRNQTLRFLPARSQVIRCECGKEFDHWDFILGMDDDYPTECSDCKNKMYFTLEIKVYKKGEIK